MPYADLHAALESRVREGILAAQNDGPLRLYTYSNRCVYERLWDDISVLARGLILDVEAREVVATPFPKFFNYGEGSYALPNAPFEVYEKMDGSLGIVFFARGRWRVATKGSFRSEQARWAEARLPERLVPGVTYLYELIYPQNRIVVRYDYSDLVLLAAFASDGREYRREEVLAAGAEQGVRVVPSHAAENVDALLGICAGLPADREGFVVRFASGLRIKLKGDAYRRVHALVSNVTPLGIWRAMLAREDLDGVRREIPEEFWSDYDVIRSLLQARLTSELETIETAFQATAELSDKELGLKLTTLPETVRGFLFARRKGRWLADDRTWASLCERIRPAGNTLPGYRASTLLLGAQEAE